MIVNPAIIALVGGSWITVGFAAYAGFLGLQIIRHWDLAGGSERQLVLERRTYLVSTIMAYLLALEIFSLFLFIYTADHLHPMFVGAMCAAGSLHVDPFGYPALLAKIAIVLYGGVWLLINRADNRAEDYPLIRFKYWLLLGITILLVGSALLQTAYFRGLRANVITSCCGTLFSSETRSIAGAIAALPIHLTRIAFFISTALHLCIGAHYLKTARGAGLFGWSSAAFFAVAAVSVVSFISVYYYALPTHHCPFDLLQPGYHFVGYPLYAALFVSAVTGIAVGVMGGFAGHGSLATILPPMMRRLGWISLAANLAFTALAVYPMIFSDFILGA